MFHIKVHFDNGQIREKTILAGDVLAELMTMKKLPFRHVTELHMIKVGG